MRIPSAPAWSSLALAAALLAVAVHGCFQNWQGGEIATHPDEAGHFVTSMMLHDYFSRHLGENPLAFAEAYYARFPKVALGHWPPGYYGLTTLCYAWAGVGLPQAHALNLVLAAMVAFCWTLLLRRVLSWPLALGLIAFCFTLPVMQQITALLLSDIAVFAGTGATLALWLRALSRRNARAWAWLGIALTATLWMKGNAWPLVPAMVLATWLNREGQIKMALGAATAASLAAGSFYLYAKTAGLSYPLHRIVAVTETNTLLLRTRLAGDLLDTIPWPLMLLAAAGSWIARPLPASPLRRLWAFATAASAAMLVFLWLTGLSYEPRVAAPLILLLLVLAVIPASSLERWHAWGAPLLLGLLLAAAASWRMDSPLPRARGFRELTSKIGPAKQPLAVLVASDAIGEGAVVAHRLLADESRQGVVLRGSRLFSQQRWSGAQAVELYTTKEQVQEVIDHIGVHFVILDSQLNSRYAALLRELSPAWELLERRRHAQRVLELYRIPAHQGQAIREFSFPMGVERNGRRVHFRPGPL